MKKILFAVFIVYSGSSVLAQSCYWQQKADYNIHVDFDDQKHQFQGKEKIIYHNNSSDTLKMLFFHLYFNAFKPGSAMDVRSRTINDPDPRVRDRIYSLNDDQIGYQKIKSLRVNGKKLDFTVEGTILEIELAQFILPQSTATIELDFEAQVPVQIRRSGRNNKELIAYSMSQWYPKLCEYDAQGWHANPYIGREFYGVWGNFDVTIVMDKAYTIAATGYLQNPNQIGHGYQDEGVTVETSTKPKLIWHFIAPDVHDFVWAADKQYKHTVLRDVEGTDLHFFYQTDTLAQNWDTLVRYTAATLKFMNKNFGKYIYKQFSVIQGGDGGMEYPMATLITSHVNRTQLINTVIHEFIHNWYYGMLATNESKYSWMDEGFTSYAENLAKANVYGSRLVNVQQPEYNGYYALVNSGFQEPLTTHADHYNLNRTYSQSSYSKGAVTLCQLGYIIGQEKLQQGLLNYYDTWKLKHPTADDFKRVMEKTSNLELDWYFENFIGTTKTIDYSIRNVAQHGKNTTVDLERKGQMPMPIDVVVYLKNGKLEHYNIPLDLMRGQKKEELITNNYVLLPDWTWTYPYYRFTINHEENEILAIVIDPTGRLADIDQNNNFYPYDQSIIQIND